MKRLREAKTNDERKKSNSELDLLFLQKRTDALVFSHKQHVAPMAQHESGAAQSTERTAIIKKQMQSRNKEP